MNIKLICITIVLLSLVGVGYAEEIGILSDGIAHISFPADNSDYEYFINNFSWSLNSGTGITFHDCFYKLNNFRTNLSNCSSFEVSFSPALTDNAYNLELFANFFTSSFAGIISMFFDIL